MMQVHLEEHLIKVVVIRLQDRIDAFNSPELRRHIEALLAEGNTHLVVDLTEVTFFDSAALAVLVSAVKRSRQAGGDVKLVWPKAEAAQRIIRLTKFDKVFVITDTAEEARAAFGGF